MKRKNAAPEFALHKACAHFLNLALPHDAWWTTIPGGMRSSAREGAKYKAMGYRRGAPDAVIVYRGRPLFVELKAGRGRLSKEQIATCAAICSAGGFFVRIESVESLETYLLDQDIPLRATAGAKRSPKGVAGRAA